MSMMTLAEIEDLLGGADDRKLFSMADEVRRAVFGESVYLRGVVEFSNVCSKNCLYCGLRGFNPAIARYRMDADEIFLAASLAPQMGIGTVVLQSGDDSQYGKEYIGEIIREIKSLYDVAVTLSLGDRRKDEYRYWRECGADRYLLKIETFDKTVHEHLRPGQTLKNRLERLDILRDLGFEVGSGIIIGLPGTDTCLLAEDILALSLLDLDMIAVGPFVPHPDTPLAHDSAGDLLTSYRTLALLRIMNPGANMPATSSLSALRADGKAMALRCGANVVMPSITPESVRAGYNIYPGKNTGFLRVEEEVKAARQIIVRCGLFPSSSKGFAERNNQ